MVAEDKEPWVLGPLGDRAVHEAALHVVDEVCAHSLFELEG